LIHRGPIRLAIALLAVIAVSSGAVAPAAADLRDLWPFGRKKAEEPVPDPFPYAVTLNIDGGDRRVRKALSRASNLVENRKTPPSGLTGLLARARQDVGRLTAVLYENAYYAGEIATTINGQALASIGPFDPIGSPPANVVIDIRTGQPFVFGVVDAEPLPRGVTVERLGLISGEPAGSQTVLAAEAALVDAWRQRGYPLARAGNRDTVADHRTHMLDVVLHADTGPIADFGRVEVIGAENVNTSLIVGRADLGQGLYSSRHVKNAEMRLRDLGVFESVRITPAAALDPDGTIPMTITVSERKRHVIGGTLYFSSTEGLGAEIYWRNRNLFGGAEQLQLSASVSRVISDTLNPDFRVTSKFIKPGVFDPLTDFTLRAEGYRETTEAYEATAVEGEVGLTRIFSDTISGSIALELARSRVTDDEGTTSDHLLLSLPTTLVIDTRDNRLNPTRGIFSQLLVEPTYDFLQDKAFATFGADFATYRAFGPTDRFVLAGRVATSILTVDDVTEVAPDRRIYLGGAGTVRGYGFKNIAPRDGGGDIIGGQSSILFSGEARYRLTDQIGIVAFTDIGSVSSSILPDIDDIKVGVGAGVRYLTAVGPIRLDVAVPLQPDDGDPVLAVYVGLGQAF
jgi:translocation and assembly module TamA